MGGVRCLGKSTKQVVIVVIKSHLKILICRAEETYGREEVKNIEFGHKKTYDGHCIPNPNPNPFPEGDPSKWSESAGRHPLHPFLTEPATRDSFYF